MMTAVARQILRAGADGSPEWREQRTQGIGGTDAANLVLGLESRFQMWREKKGLAEPEVVSPELQALFDYGHSREPELARIFRDRTGTRVRNTGTWARKDQPWALANPDRFVDSDGILEIKTTGAYTDAAKDWRNGVVPARAWVQAHWYAYVTGRTVLWFIAEVDRQPIILGPYDTDPELTTHMVEAATEFWSLVEDNKKPELTGPDARVAYPVSVEGKERVVDPWDDTPADLARYETLRAQRDEIDAEMTRIKESVQLVMGDAETLVDTEGRVLATWRSVAGRRTLDKAALVKAGIDPEDYMKVGRPSRRFEISKEARA